MRDVFDTPGWRDMLETCLSHRSHLEEHIVRFLDGLTKWRGEFTDPQKGWLSDIYARVKTPLLRDEELSAFIRSKLR